MAELSFTERYVLDIGKRSRVAAISLLGYDYVISFSDEVDAIWTRNKRHCIFWIHMFNRFFAFFYLIVDSIPIAPDGIGSPKLHHLSNVRRHCVSLSDTFSQTGLHFYNPRTLMTTVIVQVLLQFRVYALYQKSSRILWFMLIMSATEVSVMAVLIGVTISRIEHLPVVSTSTGCEYTGLFSFSALFWLPSLVYEPILLVLVIYQAWPTSKTAPRTPMLTYMARDSLLYFVPVYAELLASTVIWAHYPEYINLVMPWSAALPSVLGSRMLLNTREAAYKGYAPHASTFRTGIMYASAAELYENSALESTL
ncbi:hypothetical protein OBBRIDRAFT_600561 [Obba rivulosa]|uniref:DUF6533 domain-containing protein n=1 Tax=Obba rivulosa TaxID=1052685 RepID=A0A8E2AWH1_9APHY|nr:hypothetical protein OBBRIDRAFT_600561 [Obba rivulosa]